MIFKTTFSIIILLFFSLNLLSQNIDNKKASNKKKEISHLVRLQNKLDSLFLESDFKNFSSLLFDISLENDSLYKQNLIFIDQWYYDVSQIVCENLDSLEFVISLDNIKIMDDLDFFLSQKNSNWNSKKIEVLNLKCEYNNKLNSKIVSDIKTASKFRMSKNNYSEAGKYIAYVQFYRTKFFRDVCFNFSDYNQKIKEAMEIYYWIEKSALNDKIQSIRDNQPEWVKMGMSYEQYQEWWAKKLTIGSSYMGGGCNNCGKTIYKGKRGGTYYINKNGNKTYVPRN
jgi:hypothetical protein